MRTNGIRHWPKRHRHAAPGYAAAQSAGMTPVVLKFACTDMVCGWKPMKDGTGLKST